MKDELFTYYRAALVNGLCNEYKGYWQAAGHDKKKLMELVLSQQALPHFMTYCYNGQGLSKDYILENFHDYINGKAVIHDADGVEGFTYQMYVDFNGILVAYADVSALLWCSNTNVTITACRCPILYVSNNSDITLSLDGFNAVKIYLFDESRVNITDADETCQVTIYKYSDKCKVERGKYCLTKRINEHSKELRL